MLRPVEDEDLDVFFEHGRDSEAVFMAAFSSSDPHDRVAFDQHWARIRGNPEIRVRTIVRDGVAVGNVASFMRGLAREVTYWIGRGWWGQGIATAALRAFLVETGRPVFGRTAFDNVGSQRVLQKCGFVEVGRETGYAAARGQAIEEIVWALR
jgi:RimJ/RimL family protein N-acetyltransferase